VVGRATVPWRALLLAAALVSVVAFPTSGSSAGPAGLVAAYAFDEGSGATTSDASGNGHTGSLVNASWTAAGRNGGALVFNGSNARVDVPDAASLHLTTAMTLEAWVKLTVVSNAWRDVIYKGNDNYYLEASSPGGGSGPVGGATVASKIAEAKAPSALTAGTWAHLATTYDGANLRLYVNGTLAATVAKTGTIATSSNPLQIGGDSLYNQFFNGTIDDVRVYNAALTAAEIQTDMTTPVGTGGSSDTEPPTAPSNLTATAAGASRINLSWTAATDNVGVTGYRVERCQSAGCTSFAEVATPSGTTYADTGLAAASSYSYRVRAVDAAGNPSPYSNVATATTDDNAGATLVAAYGFEEGAGTTVADSSGSGNGGTVLNTTWTTSGKFGNALVFNGTNARVNVADSPSLHLTAGMTLEAWVKPNTITNAWKDVIYKGNDNYYLEGTSGNGGLPAGGGTFGGANANAYAASALPINTWSHLALTYDGATLRLYVNGTQAGSTARTGAIATSTNPLQIGGDSIFGQYFNGSIDEVRLYDGPLSLAQIQKDMTTAIGPAGNGTPDTEPPSAPGTLTATAAGSSQINLSWGPATDNVGVTGYRIDRCQGVGCTNFSHLVQLSVPQVTYTDTGLAGSTSYSYQVRAVDAAQNIGPVSNTATAVTAAAIGPGLVAAFGFEEGTGTTTADASGKSNNGSLVNATWTASGMYGNALTFNGTNARVDVPDAASLHLTTGMTLEAWVKPTLVSNAWRDVIYKANDNYYLEATSAAPGGPPAGGGIFGGTGAEARASSPLTAGSWAYLATTYDGSNVRLYVDGTLVATTPKAGSIATSTNPLQIGGDSIYTQYFAGTIDEVRVYNGPLGASQIQSDMNTPIGAPTAPSNLTATPITTSQIDLAWGASTGGSGVTGYRVERCQGAGCSNFAQIATPSGTTYSDTGLSGATSYSYRVRAVDSAGKTGAYSNIASAFTGLQVTPRAVALTPGKTQQYSAGLPGGTPGSVTWSVDGVVGGAADTGTITAAGLYTAGTAVGKHTVTATTPDQSANADAFVTNYAGKFTYHNDNMRTGQNLDETVLKPSTVNSAGFGRLFSYPLDGIAYATPLYVENVSIPNQGTHNVVYVATEHDSVYAYDADGSSSSPLWKRSFIDPANGVTTVPAFDTGECCDIAPEIGITGTPVIDTGTNTMYLVAKTKEVAGGTTTYVQRLHALDLSTGAEKLGGPVVIQGSVPGTGIGSSGGQLPFNSLRENQRTALLLQNGVLYFGFASHGDIQPYHGWVMGYDATTLQQRLLYCVSRNGEGGGVWMSGGGIASDGTGSLYFITGDGTFNANTGGVDFGDSYMKLSPTGTVLDYFTPMNQQLLDQGNHDLGSGEALLLPDQPGPHPHLMVSAGKDGAIYLVDRDNMGHFNSSSNQIVQSLPNVFPNGTPEPGNFTAPVYWNGLVFFGPLADNLQVFSLTNGLLSTSPVFRSAATFSDRGAPMAVSASGPASDGILWAIQRNGVAGSGVLYAYDPAGSSNGQLKKLYDSSQAGPRDTLDDPAAKFNPPLVANGKVYVASVSKLTVYGLLP
jgi:chitodextrinase